MSSEFKQNGLITLFKTTLIKLKTLILALILIVFIPLIFTFVCLTFGIFRYLLHKTSRWIRPDLAKIVTLRGSVLALDNLYTNPLSNDVIHFTFEGLIEIEKLKVTVTRDLLEGKFPNGEIKYPELKQYLTYWLGYYFWTNDKTFDLDRHVTIMQNLNESDSEIQNILKQMVQKPWTRERPLWEIILLPKAQDNVTLMFFRYHHSLSDGYSILRLLTEGLSDQKFIPKNAEPTYSKRNWLFWLMFPFKSFYELAEIIVKTDPKLPFKPIDTDSEFVICVTQKIRIKRIKEIKNHFGVSFASVVNAICSGTLRDIMIMKGVQVPKVFPLGSILPIPGHSEKLRNFMAFGMLQLCTGESDPVTRLRLCFKDYERLKRSSLPILRRYLQVIVTSLPSRVIRTLIKTNNMNTSGITSFPAGYQHLSVENCKCIDVLCVGGLLHNSMGIMFFALSYVDGIRITAVANDTVMTKEELEEVVRLLKKHVDILHEEIYNDV